VDKGLLGAEHILQVDADGEPLDGTARPSAETLLHLVAVRTLGANAVFHTHSVWSTLVSEAFVGDGGVMIEGYEMLKGLDGVRSHDHREWLPILDNSQDYPRLAGSFEDILRRYPNTHGVLLHRHGLYTWGADVAAAKRHVEIFEFLLEVIGRTLPHVNGRS
jgi:methylthioribulose-1-phosphate dehydratase